VYLKRRELLGFFRKATTLILLNFKTETGKKEKSDRSNKLKILFLRKKNKVKVPQRRLKLLACVAEKRSHYKRLYSVETSGKSAQRADDYHF
jgi:hypothetical protein